MAKVMTDDKHYKDIAQAIRNNDVWGILTDDDENPLKFKPEEMAANVNQVINNSYDYAYFEGWDDGYSNGYDSSWYEAQKYFTDEAYNNFWDLLQCDGKKVNYSGGFQGLKFNKDNFKPKYDIKPTAAEDMFNNCPPAATTEISAKDLEAFLKDKQVSMKQLEEELGIVFDFSNCTTFLRAFTGGLFKDLNVIDMRKVSAKGNTALAFYGGYSAYAKINKIEKIIVNESIAIDTGAFNYQNQLTHIRFEGTIGNDLAFKDSPLDKDSITNIINHLSDNTTGKTLTLNFNAVDKAFNPDGFDDWTPESTPLEWLYLIGTKPNWNIVLA